ncbi:MAG TPA: tetratricopeptide repeat protein, partial [Planctomycetota bacterium]|nr:tetratricopeptide repeat protein [Planctomycetota bacterium]
AAAEREYMTAAELDPTWTAPFWNLVLLYDQQGRYRESDRCLDIILENDPENFNALYQSVKHLVGRSDYAMAERTARRLVSLHPREPASHEALGIVLWSRDELEEAEECFRRALELDERSAGAWLGMGHVRLRQEQFAEAERSYRKALDIQPGLADAAEGLKQAAGREQRYARRSGGGCKAIPSFACASPLGGLTYLLMIVPVLLFRQRL